MDGYEFIEAASLDPYLSAVPIVVATASMKEQVEGATALLHKPFSARALLDTLALALSTSPRRRAALAAEATGLDHPLVPPVDGDLGSGRPGEERPAQLRGELGDVD
jgi:hypothetical protein